jgi:hypothetical protein
MKNLFKSLANFQQEVPVIHKGAQGYGYSYADLPAIFEKINPLLKKHGLGFTQLIMGDCVKTIIFHVESAEMIESLTEIPKNVQLKGMNDFQVLGSAITYIRRYALSSALGLVTDKDTDASGEQVKNDTQKANAGMSVQQAVEVLKTATTLDMLRKLFESLPKNVATDLMVVKTKDELKTKLK